MNRLERLDIHAFRGIPQLSLPFEGGSIVLGGANGTGKSACVDALEFLYTGTVATLAGAQGLSLRQHGPHVHARADEAWVSGLFSAGTVTRAVTGGVEVPSGLMDHVQTGAHLTFILRRAQLQQFIHAKPADRYRHLADLIGAEQLDRTEAAFKRARDAAEAEVVQAQTQAAAIDRQLAQVPEDSTDEEELLRQANDALDAMGRGDLHLDELAGVAALRQRIIREAQPAAPDPRQAARAQLVNELERGIGGETLLRRLDEYLALLGGGRSGRSAVELLQLLRRSREYIHATDAPTCPVCERDVQPRRLLARLVERVAALEEVNLHEEQLRGAGEALVTALQDTGARLRALDTALAAANLRTPAASVRDAASMLSESMRAGALVEIRDIAARLRLALDRWTAWQAEQVQVLRAEKEAAIERAEEGGDLGRVLEILQEVSVRHARGERGRQEIERLTAERERIGALTLRLERVLQRADLAYRTFNRVKNEEIQRIFDELRADLARMYDFLHPDEGHSALAIAMDPRKRGSSELRMGFYGRQDEDPRAFASEGHLDSLGLCIFLAFARRFNGDWPLLVLDDVVTAVDAAHKARVARLLLREFGDRQLFLTTHDSRWFLELQKIAKEEGIADTRHLVIEGWTLDEGPRLRAAG